MMQQQKTQANASQEGKTKLDNDPPEDSEEGGENVVEYEKR